MTKKTNFEFHPVVNLGELISVVAMLGVVVSLYWNHEIRIADNARNIAVTEERIARIEDRMRDEYRDIKGHLIRIEDKLDQKADK